MAHQPGWIELYDILDHGEDPPSELVAQCHSSRTGIGETMLHWYAIEGEPHVLQRLVDLGFSVNVQNDFCNTPLMECAQIDRYDNAKVLIENGADLSISNDEGNDFFAHMREFGKSVPQWMVDAARGRE
jgi:hypothetical protein